MRVLIIAIAVFSLVSIAVAQPATELAADARSVVVGEALAIESLARGGRSLIVTDPIEASLVRGDWTRPAPGDEVSTPDGRSARWQSLRANEDGVFSGRLARGYVHVIVRSDTDRIMMLHARGHRHVLVNGVRRGGDVYNLGFTVLPIELREGENELLFRGARGRLHIELREPEGELVWVGQDLTLASAIEGSPMALLLAAPVANATTRQLLGVGGEVLSSDGMSRRRMASGLGAIPPLGVRKLALNYGWDGNGQDEPPTFNVRAATEDEAGPATRTHELSLRLRKPHERHDRTFISGIDGSVQYYAVTPRPNGADGSHGLIMSLHGASVEARNQAAAYEAKPWATIVAPTNRRPFGFDWEDWGRLDALEVFEHAVRTAESVGDPIELDRRWLTGHSMGGHGTWQVGAHFAPRFVAIGPSAGWRDFWSYGGAGQFDEDDPIGTVLNTATNASRTLLLERNYEDLGVYVLHGDADDNVPVSQARFMRERLGAFHTDFAYYEQAGAGHWWGNRCVDWPPMMRFFQDRSIELAPPKERFTTVSPAISGEARLVRIVRQARSMSPTSIECARATENEPITVSTDNVLAFELLAGANDEQQAAVRIDGQQLEHTSTRFVRDDLESPWRSVDAFDTALKGADRDGPFKHAFDNRVVFVYATGGTAEENAWAMAKARYDADVWQYRANGSVDVVSDTAFDVDDPSHADRNVIVYGCADTHLLWNTLLGGCPIRIARGNVRVGDRVLEGEDIAAHFVYPRPGSEEALVGVVSGTGAVGRRLADPARYFVSGVGYPDWMLTTPTVLTAGQEGVAAAGFFGPDWSVDWSQSGWRR